MSELCRAALRKANVGKVQSEASKEKNRLAHIGIRPSVDTRIRMSVARKGRIVSEETKNKLRLARLGHQVSEATRTKLHFANLGKKLTEEQARRLRTMNIGIKFTEEHKANLRQKRSPETKAKMSVAFRGRICSESTRQKIRDAWALRSQLGIPRRYRRQGDEQQHTLSTSTLSQNSTRVWKDTPETRAKKSQARLGMKFTSEHCANVGRSKKLAWQNPEWRDKVVKAQRLGCLVHPNRAETAITLLLDELHPGEWKFVGDGSLVIGGKNPDFTNVNGQKKLIELFGNYWHRGQNPQDRIDLFAQFGFATLVIWERELDNPTELADKITMFTEKDTICH
jgi:hypothetical protein